MNTLLLENISVEATKFLSIRHNYNVVSLKHTLSEDDLIQKN